MIDKFNEFNKGIAVNKEYDLEKQKISNLRDINAKIFLNNFFGRIFQARPIDIAYYFDKGRFIQFEINGVKIEVDEEYFPNGIDKNYNYELMVVSRREFGSGPNINGIHEEYWMYEAIPSPISITFTVAWNQILQSFFNKTSIMAKIDNINKDGFVLDIANGFKIFYPYVNANEIDFEEIIPIEIVNIFSDFFDPRIGLRKKTYDELKKKKNNTQKINIFSERTIIKKDYFEKIKNENYLDILINKEYFNKKEYEYYANYQKEKLERKIFLDKQKYEELNERRKKIISEQGADIYIFDTNVLMDFPDLCSSILTEKKKVCIPNTVLEELDGLKSSNDTNKSFKAREGLKIINKNIEYISFENPSMNNLPSGLDKNKNDNRILSIALEYNKSCKAIIVTSDIGIIVKAKSQNIHIWEYNEDEEK